MKKISIALIVAFTLVAVGAAQAGPATFGLKGGLSLAKITGDNTDDLKTRTGFLVGGFAALPMGESMSIQPEVYYAQKGAKFDDAGTEVKVKLDYIDIPVLFKYTVAGESARPYFLVGPSIGFLTSAKFSAEGQSADVKDFVTSTDFGLVFGLGVAMQQFLIEARYDLGLTNLNDGISDNPDDSVKNSVIAIQIGYAFN